MTLTIGFVGTGGIAKSHQAQLAQIEGVEVTAFAGSTWANTEKAAAAWSNARAYRSLADMLDDRKLDAVYLCVPPDTHEGLEEALIERGIPFLVEKPLAHEPALPQRLAAAISEKNLLTSVGYHWRYLPSVDKAKKKLRDTTFGMALGYWMGTMPMADWWIAFNRSGGQFVEQTTHMVDLLRYLCGEITEVYAAYDKRVMHKKVEKADVYDVGTVTMKLANGGVATLSNTCMLPHYHTVGLDLFTEKGTFEVRDSSLKIIKPEKTSEYHLPGNPIGRENEAFIHALRTGDRSLIRSDYADSLKTHEVTMAANQSAASGLPVKLENQSR
ncbi:Gfo/Idh/MocA family protein [Gorillibacterium massiliense]|uniref:Gfo/Idh/MocA family protein n=1 Tax=Gorillibacterium massiliense TaxID=1280390 RepID=UPI0004B6BC41|nr:Gfo/Idh/MocA family oxidoreductase [Gorillibacterium massiliense]